MLALYTDRTSVSPGESFAIHASSDAGPCTLEVARVGATLANRQLGQPEHVLQISNRAQQRLHRVHQKMKTRGKPHNVTVVAVARELACFLWAAATAT